MPQYLEIEIGGQCVARMETSHRTGTRYDICWCSNFGFQRSFLSLDTGVPCQPEEQDASKVDFQNDFIHARRAIAAASSTAKQFLNDLPEVENDGAGGLERIEVYLRTNCFDRGRVTIEPQEGKTANLRIEIGTGPIRTQNAQPSQVAEFSRLVVDLAETASSLELVLQLLDSEGAWITKTLAENA
jgi:hypothetical protein